MEFRGTPLAFFVKLGLPTYAFIQDIAANIHRGLIMSESEKETRQAALWKVVQEHTSHIWASVLVKMLLSQVGQNTARGTPVLDRAILSKKYNEAKRRLLMFDYDVSQFSSLLSKIIFNHNNI